MVLLVLSLSGLTLLRTTREQFVVFALDESLSIGDETRQQMQTYLDRATAAAGRHRVASCRSRPTRGRCWRSAARSPRLNREGTNLAAAFETAKAAIPPSYVPHIVLLSDGNQSSGDALKAALGGGVPISTVPLATRSEPEVAVSSLQIPAQVREGEPFYVEVLIDSNHEGRGPDRSLSRGAQGGQ